MFLSELWLTADSTPNTNRNIFLSFFFPILFDLINRLIVKKHFIINGNIKTVKKKKKRIRYPS